MGTRKFRYDLIGPDVRNSHGVIPVCSEILGRGAGIVNPQQPVDATGDDQHVDHLQVGAGQTHHVVVPHGLESRVWPIIHHVEDRAIRSDPVQAQAVQ